MLRLAKVLRAGRRTSGLSYRELAEMTKYSIPALSVAASGKKLASWEVTQAYLMACGITGEAALGKAKNLWKAASDEQRRLRTEQKIAEQSATRAGSDEIGPAYGDIDFSSIDNLRSFADALATVRETAGLTVRQIIDRSQTSTAGTAYESIDGKVLQLKRTTVYDVINKKIRPSAEFTALYLHACGLTDEQVTRWVDCLKAVQDTERRITAALKALTSEGPTIGTTLTSRRPNSPDSWNAIVTSPSEAGTTAVLEERPQLAHPDHPQDTPAASKLIRRQPRWLTTDDRAPDSDDHDESAAVPPQDAQAETAPEQTERPDPEATSTQTPQERQEEQPPAPNNTTALPTAGAQTSAGQGHPTTDTGPSGPLEQHHEAVEAPPDDTADADVLTTAPAPAHSSALPEDPKTTDTPRTHRRGARERRSYGHPPEPYAIQFTWHGARNSIQLTIDRDIASAVIKMAALTLTLSLALVALLFLP
ncbi:helix-turn-helix domain-containing protein [Actinoplanes siamensis]|uniref:helix-turn-helix domain-containing protein n=1 Tax=Actinoplanes siamensis TaxID=1223317 RepID=UPI0019422BE2|nr:helix-turn-helix transcriptional regulator [Actinoplanes siamensis]